MSGQGRSAGKGSGKAGPGGRTKSGKPRPGTGGQGKRKLEGKKPTPPAQERPYHPAKRRADAAARAAARPAAPRTWDDSAAPRTRPAGPRAWDDSAASRTGPAAPGTWNDSAAPRTRSAGPRAWDDSAAPRTRPAAPRTRDETGPPRTWAAGPRGRSAGAGPAAGGRPAPGSRLTSGRGAGPVPEFVVGRNSVLEALAAAVPAQALLVGPRLDPDERIGEAVKLAAGRGIPVVEAGRAELDRMTGGAIHQGLALRVRPYVYRHPDDLVLAAEQAGHPPLIVALDGITDPRNLGAIVRSVAAFGGDGVLIPSRRAAGVTAGAWKASAGALASVPVAQAPNLSRSLAGYAEAGLFAVGLDASAETEIGSLALADGPLVLVVGSEGQGLSRLIAKQCDALVKIPITGAESLNASVAAGIAIYQVMLLRAAAAAGELPG